MKRIKAFLLGMWEFRQHYTYSFNDDGRLLLAYSNGRALAHRLTLWRYLT